jgi:flavin reductase (DIM6/NTAB) family NADH-FMN oxidoreductase RutF
MTRDDSTNFRQALSKFPTGVTVVTGRSPSTSQPVGLTVSSFNSVSLNPKLVLWSLSSVSKHLEAFLPGQAHRIHVLSTTQTELAIRFARSGSDKFSGLEIRQIRIPQQTDRAIESIPALPDCCVRFDCITENTYAAGDHSIIIARVLHFETGDREPLLFAHGSFFSLLGMQTSREEL